jgi:hypothetical protein
LSESCGGGQAAAGAQRLLVRKHYEGVRFAELRVIGKDGGAQTRNCLPLSFGWQDFLSAYLVYQVFSFEIDEMRSLFVVGQICAGPLCHHHDECAVIHVHPIASTDQFIRRVANQWTVGIDR